MHLVLLTVIVLIPSDSAAAIGAPGESGNIHRLAHTIAATGNHGRKPAKLRSLQYFERLQTAQTDSSQNTFTDDQSSRIVNRIQSLHDNFIVYSDELLNDENPARHAIPGYTQSLQFIRASRAKATEALQSKDYVSVNRIIAAALGEINKANQLEADQFALYMESAISAYRSEWAAQAAEAIAAARQLRPNDDQVLLWQSNIDNLPALIEAREQLLRAFSAHDQGSEIEAIDKILALTPVAEQSGQEIATLKERKAALQQLRRTARYAEAIAQGNGAIAQRDVPSAKSALQTAKKINPSGARTRQLALDITQLEKRIALEQLESAAALAISEDRWPDAAAALSSILTQNPTHNAANKNLKRASQVIAMQKRLDTYLAAPQRLAAANIAAAARRALQAAEQYATFSPRLISTAAELAAAIGQWQAKVPVYVVSDGETHITVRGVGQVGQTQGREIQLNPGRYTFEGKREGYVSVLIDFTVQNDTAADQTVTVICNERL